MLKTVSLELRCDFCRRWFASPLMFAHREEFNLPALFATVTRCPHCGLETSSDSDSFRARFEDGSTLGSF
jgi:hypothetical protein